MKNIKKGIVFSNDINRILKGYNALDFQYSDKGIIIPSDGFIEGLRKDFKESVDYIFDNNVLILSEDAMLESMYTSISDVLGIIPIVSLDNIYLTGNTGNVKFLDCTRLEGDSGLISRKDCNNFNSVNNQIRDLAIELINNGQTEIVLTDDVVFSGNVLKEIIKIFNCCGIRVVGIRSCIATNDSYNYFNLVLPLGLKCGYLLGKDVIDQICERDFYFGIAQSGISTKGEDGKIYKAPYFIPFGNPNVRASIPIPYVNEFSSGCISRSINLWEEMQKLSNKDIYVSDLPERINGINDEENVDSVIKILSRRKKEK